MTLRRGISMRAVYLDSVRNDNASLDYASWLAARGAEVRTVPTLPMRMLLVDRRVAVVPIDPDESSLGAVVVHQPGIVTGLVALFRTTWRTSTPFLRRRPRRGGRTFNSQERQALQLWGQGLTDESVANRLGVSERTARRISRKVAAALGARSRFQAGMRAAELGLVHSDSAGAMDDQA
jgi:DNA-binding CsgD family transcriptional regulator